MINFIFFPFTFMDTRQANVLSCFFNRVAVLDVSGGKALPGPMAALEAKGALGRISLDREKLDLAEQQVTSYLDWAAIHKGNERNLRALIREKVFLKDDSGVAAIRAGIRSGSDSHDTFAATGPGVTESLVFLKLADLHDREHQAIQAALDALDQDNAALFAELKGDEDSVMAQDHAQPFEPGRAMTEKRIRAWFKAAADAGCFEQDGIQVLVTTSRAVMDEFLTGAGEAINALDIDSIKVHENECELMVRQQRKITQIIAQMAENGQKATEPVPDFKSEDVEETPRGSVSGRIQIRFFSELGNVNLTQINPGGQIGVCLVELNS